MIFWNKQPTVPQMLIFQEILDAEIIDGILEHVY